MDKLNNKWNVISTQGYNSTGHVEPDTAMYSGSTGVLYTLWQYILFLRKQKAPESEIKLYEQKFHSAMGLNMELISYQENEPNFASFYGSE
jgi:hypothetical protein